MDKTYIVSIELRETHEVAYKTKRRVERAISKEKDAAATYNFLLSALHTMEAFSE